MQQLTKVQFLVLAVLLRMPMHIYALRQEIIELTVLGRKRVDREVAIYFRACQIARLWQQRQPPEPFALI